MGLPRRRFLVSGLTAVTLAGCTGDGDSADTTTGSPTRGSPTSATTSSDLDLREANVTAVAIEDREGRSLTFAVTLYHDDDGEDGYANWWQIETVDGDRLGRRDLLHAHGTREFTRSATIEVPAGVSCVVVRGHDGTHGYGGRAMLVDVESGATAVKGQGPDREPASTTDCP